MAINVFVLITGHFMCRQEFRWKKLVSLVALIAFYRWTIHAIFLVSGYESFSLKELAKAILSIPRNFGRGFASSFLGLYALVPFINKLIFALDKKELQRLILTLLVLFTGLSTFLFNTAFEYIGWYVTVYLMGSYTRIYEAEWMKSRKATGLFCAGSIVLSGLSIVCVRLAAEKLGMGLPYYYFVSDSNKLLAIATALRLFLFFRNIRLGANRAINVLAASTFGVLLIHASSDTMRKWLWQDVLKNTEAFAGSGFALHAVCSTVAVYIACAAIDMARKAVVHAGKNAICAMRQRTAMR